MAKPTKTELMALALRARGYSLLAHPRGADHIITVERYKVSPSHARRLDAQGSIVTLGGGNYVHLGGKPMPQAMRAALVAEGEALWLAAQAKTKAMAWSLADLGL